RTAIDPCDRTVDGRRKTARPAGGRPRTRYGAPQPLADGGGEAEQRTRDHERAKRERQLEREAEGEPRTEHRAREPVGLEAELDVLLRNERQGREEGERPGREAWAWASIEGPQQQRDDDDRGADRRQLAGRVATRPRAEQLAAAVRPRDETVQ